MQPSSSHVSVLLNEAVEALISDVNGIYIDGTFGRGGHSRALLASLGAQARLIGFDKDPEAVRVGKTLMSEDARFSVCHRSFSELAQVLNERDEVSQINGVLLDLGVSSPQLDNAERGFSFMNDGPLDMRMNNSVGQTAAQWLNTAKMEDIAWVLKNYGEEKFSKRMAKAIVEHREHEPFATTLHLAEVISKANPCWEKGKHPATRAFQAIRIFINHELDHLQVALSQCVDHLAVGGRMVVISFHSLEDRIVKRFFRDEAKGNVFPRGVPVTEDMLCKRLKIIGKAVKATPQEVSGNARSRSAVMRVAEKLG